MRLIYYLCILLLVSSGCAAPYKSTDKRQYSIKSIQVDDLGNVYVQYKDKLILKDEVLNKKHEYSSPNLFTIQDIDVQNPQRILVLHRGGLLSVLDNNLAVVESLNLVDLGYGDIQRIASARDGSVWLADPNNSQLLKIDRRGAITHQSSNLLDENIRTSDIASIRVSGQYIILEENSNVHILDHAGTYITSKTHNTRVSSLHGSNDKVTYLCNGNLHSCTLPLLSCSTEKTSYVARQAIRYNNRVYTLVNDKLSIQ